MRITLLFIFSIFSVTIIDAQNIIDAIRYSQFQPAGTARTAGVAGSFGSMGGDWGSGLINPAGLGDFYKSELSFGFSVNNTANSAFLVSDDSNSIDVDDTSLNLNHVGIVMSGRPNSNNWITSNLAVGISQAKNFTEDFWYQGSSIGSITERFAELANGKSPEQLDDFEAGLAYETGAIYDVLGDLSYETDIRDTTSIVNKSQIINRSGKMNEATIGWAGNYNNKFNIGVSFNVPFASFEERKFYSEEDQSDDLPIFNSLEYNENLTTSAAGFNIKLGAVAKVTKKIRVGFAAHTPTWFRLTDDYSSSMEYSFTEDNPETYSSNSIDGRFRYKLSTPWKFMLSAGTLFSFGEFKGFVNGDIEFQNFNQSEFNFTKFSGSQDDASYEIEVNDDIEGELGSALNARIGAELAYKVFRARIGINGEGSPYVIDENKFTRKTIAGGLGVRFQRFFIDMSAFRYSDSEGYFPYLVLTDGRNQLVNKDQKVFKFIMSIGFKI